MWTQSSGSTTTTRFAYDGSDLWADLNGSNTLQARYLHGAAVDELFGRVTGAGAAWYLPDHLGSVRDITNASGVVQDHINYDGFGNVSSESNATAGDRYKWTGREADAETGLQFNRARYYDPKTGRWTSQDPLGFAAGDANLYRYVGNQTTAGGDPSGLIGPGDSSGMGGPGGPGYKHLPADPGSPGSPGSGPQGGGTPGSNPAEPVPGGVRTGGGYGSNPAEPVPGGVRASGGYGSNPLEPLPRNLPKDGVTAATASHR